MRMNRPPLLLLADDDAEDRELFEEALRKINPTAVLVHVNDGAQAISYLDNQGLQQVPDAILLDYNMPNKNGPQVLDWLCDKENFRGMSKFVWSTAAQKQYVDGCLGKGALEYFVKPNHEEQLIGLVTKILDIIDASGNKA